MSILLIAKRRSRFVWLVLLGSLAVLLTGCGGGGTTISVYPADPNATHNPTHIDIVHGNDQLALAGNAVPIPLWLFVYRNGYPTNNYAINFKSNDDVQVVPNPVSTGSSGEAAVIVRVPNIPNATFAIDIIGQGADPTTFTVSSGEKVEADLSVSPTPIEILDDGSMLAKAKSDSRIWILNPDGSVRASTRVAQPGSLLPRSASVSHRTCAIPGTLAFEGLESSLWLTDMNLRLTKYVDTYTSSGTRSSLSSLIGVRADGSIWAFDREALVLLDSEGKNKKVVNFNGMGKAVVNKAGNVVGIVSRTLTEVSPDGTVAGTYVLPSYWYYPNHGMDVKLGKNGEYLVVWDTEILVISPSFQLVNRISNRYSAAGSDTAGNIFAYSENDGNPKLVKITPAGQTTVVSIGHEFKPIGALKDTFSGRVLFYQNFLTAYVHQTEFSVYDNKLHYLVATMPGYPELAVSPITGEIHALYGAGSLTPAKIDIYDKDFNLLRTISYSQIKDPLDISVANDGYTYVYDRLGSTIHIIDPSDNFERSVSTNLDWSSFAELAARPGGGWWVISEQQNPGSGSPPPSKLRKLQADGTEVWSETVTAHNFTLAEDGRIYVGGAPIQVRDSEGGILPNQPFKIVGSGHKFAVMGGKLYLPYDGSVYVLNAE